MSDSISNNNKELNEGVQMIIAPYVRKIISLIQLARSLGAVDAEIGRAIGTSRQRVGQIAPREDK